MSKKAPDILFLDSPADEDEIRRAVEAAAGRPHSPSFRQGAKRETPTQQRAVELGLKIGTYPTGMISPAAAGIVAGLEAFKEGKANADTALPFADLREKLGYGDYDATAKRFVVDD